MKLIFVYGTLKRGGANHHFLAGQQFLSEATTVPGFTLYSVGDYPGMVRAVDDTHGVNGELWGVNAHCLTLLDDLEGVAEGLYERAAIKLLPPLDHRAVETFLYLRSVASASSLGSHFRT